jgi:hypothetical protein
MRAALPRLLRLDAPRSSRVRTTDGSSVVSTRCARRRRPHRKDHLIVDRDGRASSTSRPCPGRRVVIREHGFASLGRGMALVRDARRRRSRSINRTRARACARAIVHLPSGTLRLRREDRRRRALARQRRRRVSSLDGASEPVDARVCGAGRDRRAPHLAGPARTRAASCATTRRASPQAWVAHRRRRERSRSTGSPMECPP